MLAGLMARLTAPASTTVAQQDVRLALTALLVRVARADNVFDPSERTRILKIIIHRYGLTDDAAAQLLAEAEDAEREAMDTIQFTDAIKSAVPLEERIGIIEALWAVALADGARDAEEDAVIRMVVRFLGISDVDSGRARQRADAAV